MVRIDSPFFNTPAALVIVNNEIGITLEWIYADALDAGEIVFVPITQERSKQLEWKFVVVNRRAVTFEMENYSDMWKVSSSYPIHQQRYFVSNCLIADTSSSTGGP